MAGSDSRGARRTHDARHAHDVIVDGNVTRISVERRYVEAMKKPNHRKQTKSSVVPLTDVQLQRAVAAGDPPVWQSEADGT
jgi:hypothetical protein